MDEDSKSTRRGAAVLETVSKTFTIVRKITEFAATGIALLALGPVIGIMWLCKTLEEANEPAHKPANDVGTIAVSESWVREMEDLDRF